MSWFSSLFSPNSKPPANDNALPAREIPNSTTILTKEEIQPEPESTLKRPSPAQVDNPNRNKVILGAGIAFFAFSILATRRAFVRKRLASNPAFYTNAPGHHAEQSQKVSGAREAIEALNLATINVLSLTMVATGASLWYLNINSLADARTLLRGGIGVDGTGRSEKEAEEEFEEWMATVLARKEAKATVPSKITNERGQER